MLPLASTADMLLPLPAHHCPPDPPPPTEKQKVKVIVDAVSAKAAEIAAVKDDAERDLAAAKPALDEALAALNSITPKDIVGLKALKSPPDIIKRIFDCVLLLRYWPVGDKVGSGGVGGTPSSGRAAGLHVAIWGLSTPQCQLLPVPSPTCMMYRALHLVAW
jgi:hypothetical protein